MAAIPEQYLDLVQQKKAFADLATVMPDGSPQVTPVWFDYRGGVIRVNSAKGRTKTRNMKQGAPVALSIMDPDNPYRYLQIRGKVTHVTEEGASAHIDFLGEEVHRKGQISLVASWRGARHLRNHARRRADNGLGPPHAADSNRRQSPVAWRSCATVPACRTYMRPPRRTSTLVLASPWRRTGSGRWIACAAVRSAVRPKSLARTYLASDIAHLTVGIDQIAAREVDAMDAKTRIMVRPLLPASIARSSCSTRTPPRIRAPGLQARAVHCSRRHCHRARHLVVAQRPYRPHRRG